MISMTAAILAAGLMQAADGAGHAAGRWIVSCDMPAPGGLQGTGAHRIFRLGPQLFQEWKADSRSFGSNLCLSFACTSDKGRLEGSISSSSLIMTIQLDPGAGVASWRTVGASGLSRTSGPCSLQKDSGRTPSGH
jgi:hypothetical protein